MTSQILSAIRTTLALLLALLMPLLAQADLLDNLPNGPVFATVGGANGTRYLGGDFSMIKTNTGGGAMLNSTAGAVDHKFPAIDGKVYAVASDGTGGWYIGGEFTIAGFGGATNLAHILSTGAVDPRWKSSVDGPVFAIASASPYQPFVFIGGRFTSINGSGRGSLASFNTDGSLTDWEAGGGATLRDPANDGVFSLTVGSDRYLYIGGKFDKLSNNTRYNLGRYNLATGLAAWAPTPNGPVYAMQYVPSSGGSAPALYIGGAFEWVSNISGVPGNSVEQKFLSSIAVSLDVYTPSLAGYAANVTVNDRVYALAMEGSRLVIGGVFTSVNGSAKRFLAKFNENGTLATDWNPNPDGGVRTLAYYGGSSPAVYVGGAFMNIAGTARNGLAAFNSNGVLQGWDPNAGADWWDASQKKFRIDWNSGPAALATSASGVYVGGGFRGMGGTPRGNLAAFAADGTLTDWRPAVTGSDPNHVLPPVRALSISGSTVYVGGSFNAANTIPRNNLAAFDATGHGELQSWSPSANGEVKTLAANPTSSGSTVYVGGSFTKINTETRNALAAIFSNGGLSSWAPSAAGVMAGSADSSTAVNTLAVDGSTVYVGGNFTSINNVARSALAAIRADGTLTSWWGSANAEVNTLAVSGSKVYVGGKFTYIGSSSRSYLAAMGTDGILQSWAPIADAEVNTLAVDGSTVYVGENSNGFPIV